MCPTGGISLSSSLVNTAAELKNSPLHSDLQITSKNSNYHAHKIILYSRSRKWGRDGDLRGASVLDWRRWPEETIEDLLEYIYLDKVNFLTDGSFDDKRTINLFVAASFFSLDELVTQCDQFLIDSKNRYSLPPGSAAVLTTVAFSVSKKNIRSEIKPKSGKSLLRVQSTQVDHDPFHDHNYLGIQKQEKKRKLNHQEDEEAVSEKKPSSSSTASNVINPSQSASNQTTTTAWGGARPKTTSTRPRTSEALASFSSSTSRLRNSECVQFQVIPSDQVNSQQQASLDQGVPPGSLHSAPLIPRLESLPHISSSASHNPEADTEDYVYTYIGDTAFLSADLPDR